MIFFLNFYNGVIWKISHILKDRMESATVHSNSTLQHPPCFSCLVIPSCITYDYPRVRRVAPNVSISANFSGLHSKVFREVLLQMTSQNSVLSTASELYFPLWFVSCIICSSQTYISVFESFHHLQWGQTLFFRN